MSNRKKSVKNFIISGFISIIIASCCSIREEYIYLDDSNKICFESGKDLYYQNSHDSIIKTPVYVSFEMDPLPETKVCKQVNYHYEREVFSCFAFYFDIGVNFRWFTYFDNEHQSHGSNKFYELDTTLLINGHYFNGIWKIEFDDATCYFHYNYGILKYTIDSVEWELVNVEDVVCD